jgi:hypothetical protein
MYFNLRNILLKTGTFTQGHLVYMEFQYENNQQSSKYMEIKT